ncbi:MAG TPA: hypothetical protein VF250_05625, partial [Conexibacter sp.]
GAARATLAVARRDRDTVSEQGIREHGPELLAGLFLGWLAISLTPHHDMRYTLPLLVYLSVLGTSWVPLLQRGMARTVATAALAAAVVATTLGASFGVGGRVHIPLGGATVKTRTSFGIPSPNGITLYADRDFNVSAPRRGADILRALQLLRDQGITGIAWYRDDAPLGDPVLDSQGLSLFARFAGLRRPLRFWTVTFVTQPPAPELRDEWNLTIPRRIFLIRRETYAGIPPCMRLSDDTGIWFVIGDPAADAPAIFCPQDQAEAQLTGSAGSAPAPRR